MFNFFSTILHTIATFVVGTLIATGLATAPIQKTEPSLSTTTVSSLDQSTQSQSSSSPKQTRTTSGTFNPADYGATSIAASSKSTAVIAPQNSSDFHSSEILVINSYIQTLQDIQKFNNDSRAAVITKKEKDLESLLNRLPSPPSGSDATSVDLYQLFSGFINDEISQIQKYDNFYVTMNIEISNQIDSLNNDKLQVNQDSKTITSTDFTTYADKLTGYDAVTSKELSNIGDSNDIVLAYISKEDGQYSDAINYLQTQTNIDASVSQVLPAPQIIQMPAVTTYTPPAAPQYTHCTIGGVGGGGVETVVNCTTSSF